MRSPETSVPPGPAEGLTGQVERVTFHSDESGFCVLKVSVKGRRELCTVVGTVPAVSVGEWLTATGQWGIDPRHGPQFKADQIRTSAPDNAEGIERYLASGLIKGIGPAFAARLVKKFGKDVFTVIAEKPGRLREVEGIGRSRQRAITESFRAQKVVREIMVFLHSHGVSSSRAYRIFKTYGEDAIARVQADPYCLARDIRGIGFKTADAIAARVGVAAHSDLRARAGVEYTLQELTHDGHCAYPRGDLAKKASELLGIPVELTDAAIAHGVASRRLAEHAGPDGTLVYLAPLDEAEQELAKSLARLSRGPHPLPAVDAQKAADWVETKVALKLSPTQRAALAKALTAKVMVITGGPGVGKTTLVNSIVRIFRAKKLTVVLCAPTGRAAKRLSETSGMEAKTIHRLLEFDPGSLAFKHDAAHPLKGDLFVVDEASMLDVTLCQQLVRAVPPAAALLFVGDVDQLPSVGPGSVLRDVIDSGTLPVLRLTEVFRQAAQSAIITNAHRINRGVLPVFPEREGADKAEPSDFYFVDAPEPEDGVARVLQLVTESIPRRFRLDPREDIQVLCPMRNGELGARHLNVKLQEALNPSGDSIERFGWTFRVGDRVMQTVNDYEKNVFNGDIGRIREIDPGEQELTVAFDGRPVSYGFGELDELTLAYAATVHKSQGSEYPAVVVPIHTQHYVMLQRNLLYTAVTRARKLVVLVGTKNALAIATNRVSSRRRITTLKERLVEAMGK